VEKIAIVINSLKKGGAEKQAVLLGRMLSGFYDVRIIVMRPEEGISEELITLYGVKKSDIVELNATTGRGIRGLCHVLRRWRPKSLLCYLTYANFAGAVAGRLCGVGNIYQGLRNARMPLFKVLAEVIANMLSTGAILNNHAGLSFFRRHGLRNLTVIENCYPSIRCHRKREAGERVTIVTAARFVTQKDYRTAIEAFRIAAQKMPKLYYRIIGHGEGEVDLRQWIVESGMEDRVEVIVNPVNVQKLIDECDIYLSTSLWEGTSNSIMEAMDASLPVVATAVGDNDRLIEEGVNGMLISPGDAIGIAEALVTLAGSCELRNDMGVCGNRMLEKRYGMDVFRKRYLGLLGQDVSGSRVQEVQDLPEE
jgi:Glycosyltransferase